MLHEVINIDIDYEKLGINHDDSKATITTYIKDILIVNDGHKFTHFIIFTYW